MSIGVDFTLRANTAQFTRAVAGAENSLRGLKKSLASFGGGSLASAIGITGLVSGFLGAAKAAQSMRMELEAAGKPVDGMVRNAAELGDAFDSAASAVKRYAVTALGALAEIGAKARRVIQGVTKAEEDDARALAESTEKDAIEAEKRLAEARAANSPEKIAAAEKKLAEIRRENAMRASDSEGKLVLLLARRIELEKERDALGAKTVARLEKEAELGKINQQIDDQRKAIDNEAADAAEKEKKARAEIDSSVAAAKSRQSELTARRDQIMRDEQTARADRILPSIEQLAARADENQQARANYGIGSNGSLVDALDPNDPAIRAQRALQLEQQARDAALSGDPVARLQDAPRFQAEAEELRRSLAGSVQSSDSNIGAQFKDALAETNAELTEIKDALKGLIKSQ